MYQIDYKGGDYLQYDYGKWLNINQIYKIEKYFTYDNVKGTRLPAPIYTRIYLNSSPPTEMVIDMQPTDFINMLQCAKNKEKSQILESIDNMFIDSVFGIRDTLDEKINTNKKHKEWN